MLTTNQKGAIAEAAIVKEAVRLGVQVYRPVVEGGACDLILDMSGRLVRVQCKWATWTDEAVSFRCYRSRRTRSGLLAWPYAADEVDAFAAYCFALDMCYFVPLEHVAGRRSLRLRVKPTANNQSAGINWAAEYEFAATLPSQNAGP